MGGHRKYMNLMCKTFDQDYRQKLDILELKRYKLHVLHLEDSPHLKVVGLPSFYFALSVCRNSEDRKKYFCAVREMRLIQTTSIYTISYWIIKIVLHCIHVVTNTLGLIFESNIKHYY